jgi:hypothetical protein
MTENGLARDLRTEVICSDKCYEELLELEGGKPTKEQRELLQTRQPDRDLWDHLKND